MAATIGLLQNDLKRIIAYSTCSQLGYLKILGKTTNYNFHQISVLFFLINLLSEFFFLLFLVAFYSYHEITDFIFFTKLRFLYTTVGYSHFSTNSDSELKRIDQEENKI